MTAWRGRYEPGDFSACVDCDVELVDAVTGETWWSTRGAGGDGGGYRSCGSAARRCHACFLRYQRLRQAGRSTGHPGMSLVERAARARARAGAHAAWVNRIKLCPCGRAFGPAPKMRRCPVCRAAAPDRERARDRRRRTGRAPHYRGDYQVRAREIRERAAADPSSRCWRCGDTLADHAPHKSGRPAFWTAGHVVDGDPSSPLLAEVSTCNFSHGASAANRRRYSTSVIA